MCHSISVCQSLSLSVTQSVSHSVYQSLSLLVTQSVSDSVCQSLSHSVTQCVIQSVSVSHSVFQSLGHSVCQSLNLNLNLSLHLKLNPLGATRTFLKASESKDKVLKPKICKPLHRCVCFMKQCVKTVIHSSIMILCSHKYANRVIGLCFF